MLDKYNRVLRWVLLIGSGSFLLGTGGCDLTLQSIQTTLLGGISILLFQLVRNV